MHARASGEHDTRPDSDPVRAAARRAMERCRLLAGFSEIPGTTCRRFLSPPFRDVHAVMSTWMTAAGLRVHVDAAGNLRGVRHGAAASTEPLVIASHLDTVPDAGAYDGILGVLMGLALVELLGEQSLPFPLELIGFSEEEGVRFGIPFIGSRAVVGTLDQELLDHTDASGRSIRQVIAEYGLDPDAIPRARLASARAYLEFHIEQGPVLDQAGLSVAVVEGIAGQSRLELTFHGTAGHAGTTPMSLRRDALAAAAEWVGLVESVGHGTPGLVATVGRIEAAPGAGNVIAGTCTASLDVRHRDDAARLRGVRECLDAAATVAARRRLRFDAITRLDQAATSLDRTLLAVLSRAVEQTGVPLHVMTSGAGHDAMVMAAHVPSVMLFVRSPGGISHHPDESVAVEDVATALSVGLTFMRELGGAA